MTTQSHTYKPDDAIKVPTLPEPAIRLPLAHAAQWQNALICAEREPFKDVVIEGRTVLAVHDAIRQAVLAEREKCAQIAEQRAAAIAKANTYRGKVSAVAQHTIEMVETVAAAIRAQGAWGIAAVDQPAYKAAQAEKNAEARRLLDDLPIRPPARP